MIKVTLIKGLSYSGIVEASFRKPTVEVEDDKLADILATGYFAIAEGGSGPDKASKQELEANMAAEKKTLDKMERTEVDAVAAELKIDISECKNKGDVITLIIAKKYPTGGVRGQEG